MKSFTHSKFTHSLILYSDKVFIEGKLQPATVSIEDDKIKSVHIGKKLDAAQDFSGNIIMPGAIDAHVHINEPGRSDWEGFETATKAAIRGGITTVVDMPLNSSPVVTNVAAFQKKIAACEGKLYANCGFWAGATDAAVDAVQSLISEGCLGVKVFLSHSGIDEFPNISLADLDELMAGMAHLNVPVLAHCELDTLPASDDLQRQPRSYAAYLKSRPKAWENEAIKAFINLAEKHDCKAHIVHLASDEMIDWIASRTDDFSRRGASDSTAKVVGTRLFTVETCPHYFFFNAENIPDGNTLFKCAPPIRAKSNGQNLRRALKGGIIDFIASDHSPAPPEIKEINSGNLYKAWGGIAGLQFLLSASWTALKDEMSLVEFIPLLTSKPAQFLGLQDKIGTIKEGYRADLTIWQPEATFDVKEDIIEHRHKATPYLNHSLFGVINGTIVNGQFAFQNEGIVPTPFGRKI